jgi:hypothetical protein
MTYLTLERAEDMAAWDKFVTHSAQGSLYATATIIEVLGCKADYWYLKRNGYPVLGVAVIVKNAIGTGLPPHSYYVGIMYHPEAWNCKANRRTENEMLFCEVLMMKLSKHYDRIELCLHPSISDVRGFDWFNYHTPECGRVQIYPQYTAQAALQPMELIRSEARSSRRREEKYATSRENLHFALDGTVGELVSLYDETFLRQGTKLTQIELNITEQFARTLLAQNLGVIAVVRDENNQAKTTGLLMFDHHKLVHLPVVGSSDTRYGGTMLYFGMMHHAAELGFTLMDFNGANSPARGYFKHSIGAKVQLYFHVVWERPRA